MKDGDFERLRIPMSNGAGGSAIAEMAPDSDEVADARLEAQRLGIAATTAQLAAGAAVIAGLILVGLAALRRRRNGGGPSSTGGGA